MQYSNLFTHEITIPQISIHSHKQTLKFHYLHRSLVWAGVQDKESYQEFV